MMIKLSPTPFLFLGIVALLFLVLYCFQEKLIYFPRKYESWIFTNHHKKIIEISYATGEGQQVAFYLPPDIKLSGSQLVWMLFGGNAARALDWNEFVSRYPDKNSGFFLIDYPGYGKCEGEPSPDAILESTISAVEKLKQNSGVQKLRIAVLGHSLGAAAALQYASVYPVERVVLLSPFTEMREMARKIAGPLSLFLRHNYDNRARLQEIIKKESPPHVYILHGDRDEIIPVEMSRTLNSEFPGVVKYKEIPFADHNGIINMAELQIFEAMMQ